MRNPSVLILALFAAFCLLVGFGGCQERDAKGPDPVQVEKDKKVAQVASNLKPIGQHLEATGRPLEGGAVRTQAGVLDAVVQVDPKDIPAPIVSYAEWQRTLDDKAQALRVAEEFKTKAAEATRELAEVRAANDSWWAWLKDGSALAGLLASGAAVYRGLNGPGSKLIDVGLKALFPKGFAALQGNVANLADKNAVLVTAVGASDVGREALAHLDGQIAKLPKEAQDALGGLLQAATGGKAGTLEGFFKTYAKAYAVDEGAARQVDGVLTEIRSATETSGGKSDAFLGIMEALVANRRYS